MNKQINISISISTNKWTNKILVEYFKNKKQHKWVSTVRVQRYKMKMFPEMQMYSIM